MTPPEEKSSPTARVHVHVIPRASRSALAGRRGEAFVVRLQAPPVEGAANKALSQVLADYLGVRPAAVRIISGEHSRRKLVEICGVGQHDAEKRLAGGGEK